MKVTVSNLSVDDKIPKGATTQTISVGITLIADEPLSDLALARVEQFVGVLASGLAIFVEKNTEYGDSIRIGGARGASYELTTGMGKLFNVFLADPSKELSGEDKKAVGHALVDTLNYAAIALLLLTEGNVNGQWV